MSASRTGRIPDVHRAGWNRGSTHRPTRLTGSGIAEILGRDGSERVYLSEANEWPGRHSDGFCTTAMVKYRPEQDVVFGLVQDSVPGRGCFPRLSREIERQRSSIRYRRAAGASKRRQQSPGIGTLYESVEQ